MKILLPISFFLLFTACSVSRSHYSPEKKYSPAQLQRDYIVYRSLLQAHHPGLYWYTSKDSMSYYFDCGRQQLKDSMTEAQFRKVLSWVTAKINCGHTTVRASKKANKYYDTARLGKMFPLSVKMWNEAMTVTANLNRRDSILKRGTVITAINNKPVTEIADTLFSYISTDGYNTTHKYQSLSNRGNFGSLYTSLFGVSESYRVEYKDSAGKINTTMIPVYIPAADTMQRRGTRPFRPAAPQQPQPTRKEIRQQRLNAVRLLKIDTLNRTAMMNLASFARNYRLRNFSGNHLKRCSKTRLII
ncbi:MAG: hypothetical protein IPM85_11220 [Chitinophagaceae bacterium]|nr:hypothetical protein [Chitinophagaceae bacterium]